ncbi:MAG: hypothetical protein ABWZ77_03020 [Naasia sp.]
MAVPTRSERFRPAELITLAAGVAVFVGVVVFMSTRTLDISIVSTGAAFIIALVVLAMLALAAGPIGREKDLRGGDPTAPHATSVDPDEQPPAPSH